MFHPHTHAHTHWVWAPTSCSLSLHLVHMDILWEDSVALLRPHIRIGLLIWVGKQQLAVHSVFNYFLPLQDYRSISANESRPTAKKSLVSSFLLVCTIDIVFMPDRRYSLLVAEPTLEPLQSLFSISSSPLPTPIPHFPLTCRHWNACLTVLLLDIRHIPSPDVRQGYWPSIHTREEDLHDHWSKTNVSPEHSWAPSPHSLCTLAAFSLPYFLPQVSDLAIQCDG